MTIQWFPGHMHKARLEMQATLPKVNLVIEILDARIPYSSENPLLAELRGNKPCLKVLAKRDLADDEMTATWQRHFEQTEGVRARAVTTEDVPTIRQLKQTATRMLPDREGLSITAMVVGIPNVGKSTIINYLAGKNVAKTSNTPGVTRQQQKVSIANGFMLLDTPGMLWPKVHNENSGFRLALLGSIKDTAADYTDIGFYAAKHLAAHYADRLADRYDLDTIPETELELIEAVGRRRGCIGRGNIVDLERASRILVTEVRDGKLGRITLETPETMRREKLLTEKAIAEKAERDAAKDAKRKKRFRDKQRAARKSRELNG